MKTLIGVLTTIVVFVLIAACSAVAQSAKPSVNVDESREKIKRLEGMDISGMAPSTLEIYQLTLLRLYEQCIPSLQQQIDLLATIQSSAGDSGTEAAQARSKLEQEKTAIVDKISLLRISLGLSESKSAVATTAARSTTPAPDETLPRDTGAVSSLAHPLSPTLPAQPQSPRQASASVVTSPPSATTSAVTPPVSKSPDASSVTAPPAPPCVYPNAPPILNDAAQRLAGSILFNVGTPKERAEEVGSENYKLVFYTIADGLKIQVTTPLATDPTKTKTISFGELEPYKYLGETLRTDKQLGSSSSSAAAVSAIDKPGFAWLLGFGIENGQVEKNVRNNILTLSTSPAALFMLNRSASNPYQNAGFLNRIGVSSSFNIANQNQLLTNVSNSQLREYSIKYRFMGDRSPRSKKLEKIWDDVAGDIQERLIALNDASQFISKDPVLGPLAIKVNLELQLEVVALLSSDDFKKLAAADGSVTQKQVDLLSSTILCHLSKNVLTQKDKISADAIKQFKDILVPNLITAQLNLKVVRAAFNKRIDEFFKGPLGTIAYYNHREPVLGNYSEFKFLFEHPTLLFRPIGLEKLTANAGYSFYHQPNVATRQERTRDFSAALSFEGNAASPFTETVDLGRITYSFVGRYERLLENSHTPGRKADLAALQFLMDIPLFKGLAFPFSLTYSNATEIDRRSGWHANFSLKLDTDKLLELVRATP